MRHRVLDGARDQKYLGANRSGSYVYLFGAMSGAV